MVYFVVLIFFQLIIKQCQSGLICSLSYLLYLCNISIQWQVCSDTVDHTTGSYNFIALQMYVKHLLK